MGESPPVHGIHDADQRTDLKSEDRSVTVFYDPEEPDDTMLQGDVLNQSGPSLDVETSGPSIR